MLLDYDTILFDLDFTIWDGCKPLFWARLLQPPFRLDGRKFYDGISSDHITLQAGIDEVLKILSDNKRNLGFASRGGAENIEYNKQPTIIALKAFGIYKYFNYQKILVHRTVNKAALLEPSGKTLYIDDNNDDLEKVIAIHGNLIDTLNRNSFQDWRSMI